MMLLRLLIVVLGAATLAISQPAPSAQSVVRPPRGTAPQRTLAEYNHRAWRLVDNCPPDIWALAQSPDGFLWIGSGAGLYRFDGILFEQIVPRTGRFPSRNVTALLAEPDGTMWIGYFTGEVSRLREGKLETFGGPGGPVEQIALARDGSAWAAKSGVGGGLFRFDGARVQRMTAAQGFPDEEALSVLATRRGDLWVSSERRISVLRTGSRRFVQAGTTASRTRLAEAPNGTVWASGRATPMEAAGTLRTVPAPPGASQADADRMIVARDGSLWFSAFGGGVDVAHGLATHGSKPGFERIDVEDGLTSAHAVPVLEDREGNMWIGTNLGLNRLRPVSAVVAIPSPSGSRGSFQLAETDDGAVFVAEGQRLYRARPGAAPQLLRSFDQRIRMIEGDASDLMIGFENAFLRLDREGKVSPVPGPPPPGIPRSWSRDASGTVWVTINGRGVLRRQGGSWREVPLLGRDRLAGIVHTPSGEGGGEWLYVGPHLYRRQGADFARLTPRDAPDVGNIALVSTGPSAVLVGGEDGLAILDGSRFRTLRRNAVDLIGITGIVQSGDGTIWINGIRGLIRTTRADLMAAIADPDRPLRHRLFDAGDGLPGLAQQDDHKSTAVRGGDGRIWVANNNGVAWVDPARIVTNHLPPPVIIREANANGRRFPDPADLKLAAGTRNLRITYTALSLAASQHVRFRYRLVGVDQDWVDAGSRREAFYANLPPGEWRFQVIASNNDGVWNKEGASIGVSIPPMFYQSWWFRALCAAALVLLLWLLYLWRLREHMVRTRALAETQLGERARIARELHDTLLQGMQGLMLRFQAVSNAVREDPKTHAMLEGALERADDLILEARERVQGLRSMSDHASLSHLIERSAERCRAEGLEVTVSTQGNEPPNLPPATKKPLASVVEEALTNVLKHAEAQRAIVTLTYAPRSIAVRIEDDGKGLPPEIAASGERSGHYGLIGMRERMEAAGGKFQLSSAVPRGTVVEASVPLERLRWKVGRGRGERARPRSEE